MKKESAKIAIVIPAYNESLMIRKVIKSIVTKFEGKYSYKIIVVDDGSQDDTAYIAERAGAFVIRHILNTGVGGATATGLSYANQNGFDIAVTMDADGQHAPKDVIQGIKILENEKNTDLLIGSRLIDGDGMSRVKIIGNKGLSTITYLIFGINSTDSQSGLRVFSHRALEKLKWKTSGYEFCSEMLWRAKQVGLIINEYPIKAVYTDYSKSKGQNNWNAFKIVGALIKQRAVEIFGE